MRKHSIALTALFFLLTLFSVKTVSKWLENRSPQARHLSSIFETDCLDEVRNHIDEQSLIVFDLDNTLVTPSLMVGSDSWFTYMTEQKCAKGYTLSQAVDEVLPLYRELTTKLRYLLVENTIPQLLKFLQNKQLPTIILTNRGYEQKENVLSKISQAGVPMIFTQLGGYELTAHFEDPFLYSHGIIFCGKNDKGKMLFHVLDKVNCHPSKIIFIDDKYRYLASVESACVNRKIPFVGIRYAGCDKLVSQFDPKQAEKELEELLGPVAAIPVC